MKLKIKREYGERDFLAENLEVGTILEDYLGYQVKVIRGPGRQKVFLRWAKYGDAGLAVHYKNVFVRARIVERALSQPCRLGDLPPHSVFQWGGGLYLKVYGFRGVEAVCLTGNGYLSELDQAVIPVESATLEVRG